MCSDEGISGTSLAHRDEFNQMISDCRAGKIDRLPASATDKVFSANLEGVLQGIRFMGIRCHTGWEREIPGFNCVVPVVNANVALQKN